VSESKFGNQLADMLLADGATTQPSVMGELMRERFEGDRRIRQTETVWVADGGPLGNGHWETIEVIDVGPAPS
jgi:hypothetical protein